MIKMMRAITAVCAAAAMAGTGWTGASAAEKVHEFKLATFTAEAAPDSTVLKNYAKEWEQKSNGRIKVEIFWGGSMGPMPRQYELVQKGVADLTYYQQGVTPGRFPLTELILLPYVLPDGAKGAEVGAKVLADLNKPYLAKEYPGTKVIWLAVTRPASIFDGSKEIRSVADLKGRRYRAPTETISAMLKSLGANPIGLPAPLMAESLQKGTIDGVITDATGVFAFKLGGLVKYNTPMFLAVLSFGFVMNQAAYDGLPADLRKIIDDSVAGPERAAANAKTGWGGSGAMDDYVKNSNVQPVRLDPAADQEMRRLSDEFIETKLKELDAKKLPGRAVYKQMKELSAKYSK